MGTGIIVGTTYDSANSILPGTQITISNLATNETFTTTTNDNGLFTTPPLVPGTYQVRAVHKGFKTGVQDHVVVQVGSRVETNFTLMVGQVNESVTVSALPPDLNTTSAGLGVAFDETQIQNLPVNSRAALSLAALTPGAHSPFGADIEGQGDRGDEVYAISIDGAPGELSGIVMDGVNLQLTDGAEVNIDPTADALSEFKIESGVLDPSYGYTAGGVINMVTKSGTGQFHGSLYEYLRNDFFDARNYFLPVSSSKPEFRYNQYGGTAGGPIKREKAFFFGNFEGYNYIKGAVTFASVPTAAERAGDFSHLYTSTGSLIQLYDPRTTAPNPSGSGQVRQPFTNNNVSSEIDPVALNYQNTFYPLPNTTPTNVYTNSNNYVANASTINLMRQGMGRIDYRLTPNNSVFVRYYYFQFTTNNPSVFGNEFARADEMRNQDLVVGDTHSFSAHLINDLRLGGTMNIGTFSPTGEGHNWPQKLGMPSSVPSTQLPIMTNGEAVPNNSEGYRGRVRGEITDTVTQVVRTHTMSYGFDIRKSTDSYDTGSGISGSNSFSAAQTDNPQNPGPTGNQYASFLIGDVSSATYATFLGYTDVQNTVAFFVEDNWKAARSLTLNLGLRYDYQEFPYELNNHYSNWNPNVVDSVNNLQGAYQFAGTGGLGRNFYHENYLNFGPRIGFAWAFGPRGNSVLRGGYSIYYTMQDEYGYESSTTGITNSTAYSSSSPYTIFQLSSGIPSAPIPPLGAALGPAAFLGQSATETDPHAPSPMAQVMNLTIEQALPWGLVAQASAVHNHGIHFPASNLNLNSLNPQYYSLGLALQNQVTNPYYGIVPSSSSLGGPTISEQQSLLPFPYYSTISTIYDHIGYYDTNLGEFQITKRKRDGLTFVVGYTIGKMIDIPITFQSAPYSSGLVFYSASNFQNVYNIAADRALDVADVSQRATFSILYELPFGRGQRFSFDNHLLNALAGGWQLNDVTILQKGLPVAVTGASNNLATRPNFVSGVSAKLAHPSIKEWFNTAAFINPPLYTFGNVPRTLPNVRGPGAANFDISLFKEFPVRDSVKVSVRAESFNIFNHPDFQQPNSGFSAGSNGLNASGTFGTSSSTNIDNRQLQFALKLSF